MVGGSLRGFRLLPTLKLVAMILLKVALKHQKSNPMKQKDKKCPWKYITFLVNSTGEVNGLLLWNFLSAVVKQMWPSSYSKWVTEIKGINGSPRDQHSKWLLLSQICMQFFPLNSFWHFLHCSPYKVLESRAWHPKPFQFSFGHHCLNFLFINLHFRWILHFNFKYN